jgi:hypothetical protein
MMLIPIVCSYCNNSFGVDWEPRFRRDMGKVSAYPSVILHRGCAEDFTRLLCEAIPEAAATDFIKQFPYGNFGDIRT